MPTGRACEAAARDALHAAQYLVMAEFMDAFGEVVDAMPTDWVSGDQKLDTAFGWACHEYVRASQVMSSTPSEFRDTLQDLHNIARARIPDE